MEKENKVFGYCRISKKTQSIERQITNIRAVYPKSTIIQEAFTGTKIEGRKAFNNLLKKVKEGDTIVFDSVSRMSRNAEEGFKLYKELFEKGINLEFIKEKHINTEVFRNSTSKKIDLVGSEVDILINAMNEYMFMIAEKQIIIAFEQAEKEVKDLQERTKEGIREARAKAIAEGEEFKIGRKEGTKFTTKKSIESKEKIKKYSKHFLGDLKDDDVMRLANISRKTFYKYKKELVEELKEIEKKEPKEIDLDKISQKEINKIAIDNAKKYFDNGISPFGLNSQKKKDEKKKINFVQL